MTQNDTAKLQQLLNELTNNPDALNDMSEEDLLKFENLVSPYGTVPECNIEEKFACIGFTNLRHEYMKRLLTTGLVGYLYRRCDEYSRDFQETVENMDDMKKTERDVLKAQKELAVLSKQTIEKIKERDAKEQEMNQLFEQDTENQKIYATNVKHSTEQLEEWRAVRSAHAKAKDDLRVLNRQIDETERKRSSLLGLGKRFVVRQFLDEQFRFNPDKHVRASYASSGETYIEKFVPPKDTFHNFQTYLDQNYEELRGVTERLYSIAKPDLDVAILPCGVFGSQEDADNFVERNKENVICDIRTLSVGKWNLIESFKANRDKIEAYRGTIVDDILEQVKEDTKIGSELTMARVSKRRMENARSTMPPPEMVKQYIADKGEEISSLNKDGDASKLTDEQREELYEKFQNEKREEQRELIRTCEGITDDVPHDALKVNVYKFAEGGKNLKKSHFFTKAKKPEKR